MSFFQSIAGFGTINQILAQNPQGGPIPSTFAITFGTINIGASTTATISLAGLTHGYTGPTTYAVGVSSDDPANHAAVAFNQTGNSFQIRNSDAGGAHNYMWIAVGF